MRDFSYFWHIYGKYDQIINANRKQILDNFYLHL
jgi:hypothetical protein